MTNLKTTNSEISEGDLVTLGSSWCRRNKPGQIVRDMMRMKDDGITLGIVTHIRLGAGMYENNHYATVLWEDNRYAEHYLRDLRKVQH